MNKETTNSIHELSNREKRRLEASQLANKAEILIIDTKQNNYSLKMREAKLDCRRKLVGEGQKYTIIDTDDWIFDESILNISTALVYKGVASAFLGYTKVYINDIGDLKPKGLENLFFCCDSLEHVSIQGIDTSEVKSIEGMFYNCYNLQELDLSYLDTSKVTNMQDVFFVCDRLKKINLFGFNTSNVTNMRGMFQGCTLIEELNLYDFDTSKVQDMSNMFSGCMSIKELDLSNFNTKSVRDMSYMFQWCWNLQLLDISRFDAHDTDTTDMFQGCTCLKRVIVNKRQIQIIEEIRKANNNVEIVTV